MASASKTITLILSDLEAGILCSLLRSVGGSQDKLGRREAAEILDVLEQSGVCPIGVEMSGGITFEE